MQKIRLKRGWRRKPATGGISQGNGRTGGDSIEPFGIHRLRKSPSCRFMDACTELLRQSRTQAMPGAGAYTLRAVLRSHC